MKPSYNRVFKLQGHDDRTGQALGVMYQEVPTPRSNANMPMAPAKIAATRAHIANYYSEITE
jgi:hypothetical protein